MSTQINRIVVKHGYQENLAKIFKVSNAFVSNALRGKQYGEKAIKIRHVAMTQFEGKELIELKKESHV